MSHLAIDKEIAHLEAVLGVISTTRELFALSRFPLRYWQQRLADLKRAPLIQAQRARVARLEALLHSLDAAGHDPNDPLALQPLRTAAKQ